MQFLCGYSYLCSKSELGSVGKGGGGIVVYAGSIYLVEETGGCLFVFGDYALAVSTAVLVYVIDGFVEGVYDFDAHVV